MKMRLAAYSLTMILAFGASFVNAQQAMVRSGEHEGFSRLAVDLRNRVPWEVSGAGKSQKVLFDSGAAGLNVSEAFDRISGNRIVSIDPLKDGSGIQLGLNCDCKLDVFWHGTSMLVIDIRDQTAPQEARNATRTIVPKTSVLPPLGSAAATGGQDIAVALTSAHFNLDAEVFAVQPTPLQRAAIDEARQSIVYGIQKAVILGLVENEITDANLIVLPEEKDQHRLSETEQVDHSVTMNHPQINLDTSTSADLEAILDGSSAVQTATGDPCVASDLLAVGQWGTNGAFSKQIGLARTSLTEEFDRYRPGAALELARLYVFFGFGAEAIQVIESMDVQGAAAEAVIGIAQLIDLERMDGSLFDDQTDCVSDAALWSMLSSGRVTPEEQPNVDAILRALIDQPDHLKALLGARVARMLAGANRATAAARVLRILDRQPHNGGDAQIMAQAETDLSTGQVESADLGLKDVVASNGALSSEALVRRIENRLAEGDPVPPELVELAGAYAHEQRDSPVGAEIALAYIGSLAASGQYDRAFEELKEPSFDKAKKESMKSTNVVISYATKNASDLSFLKHLMSAGGVPIVGLTDTIANEVANRLINLGFHAEAKAYLSGPAAGGALNDRRLLRAEINLAENEPRSAIVNLLGLIGTDADTLRAEAHSQMGEHGAAHLLYLSAGQTSQALREALLAEEWSEARDISDPVLSDVIDDTSLDFQTDPSGTLARNRMLLEQSADARSNISKLLELGSGADDAEG